MLFFTIENINNSSTPSHDWMIDAFPGRSQVMSTSGWSFMDEGAGLVGFDSWVDRGVFCTWH
jgi:tetrahydromethanopterin S-methyltransferase subunit B